jgi:hypothetical protein
MQSCHQTIASPSTMEMEPAVATNDESEAMSGDKEASSQEETEPTREHPVHKDRTVDVEDVLSAPGELRSEDRIL